MLYKRKRMRGKKQIRNIMVSDELSAKYFPKERREWEEKKKRKGREGEKKKRREEREEKKRERKEGGTYHRIYSNLSDSLRALQALGTVKNRKKFKNFSLWEIAARWRGACEHTWKNEWDNAGITLLARSLPEQNSVIGSFLYINANRPDRSAPLWRDNKGLVTL